MTSVVGAIVLALALALSVLVADAALAEVAPTQLFEQLRNAPDAERAAEAESRIWQRWMQHANEEVSAQFTRGVQALDAGDLSAAVRQFSTVLQMAPEFAEAWNKRATTYYLMDELAASVADIERTLLLEPRHFGALSGLGLIQLARGNLQDALTAFEKVLTIYPRAESALFYAQQLRRALRRNSI